MSNTRPFPPVIFSANLGKLLVCGLFLLPFLFSKAGHTQAPAAGATQNPTPHAVPSEALTGPVDARLESSLHGGFVQLSSLRSRVQVVFYEHRSHTGDNETLKGELGRFIADNHLEGRLTMLPAANASGYNYAPANSLVRTGVRAVAERINLDILLDFDGVMLRAPFSCRDEASNVLVLDRSGRILFRHAGVVGSSERTQLYRAIRRALSR